MAITQVSVHADFNRPDGKTVPPTGQVSFTALAEITDGATSVPPIPVTATLDGSGEATVSLAAVGTDTRYQVVESIAGATARTYVISLSDQVTSVELAALAPVTTAPPGVTYVSSVDGMTGAVDLTATYALQFQTTPTYAGGAPNLQFPTTRTLNIAGTTAYSVLGFQNNDPAAPDSATRLYIVPRQNTHPTSGVGGALKIFGDDYFATDGTGVNYRDFGLYFHANQGSTPDTGTNGSGVFWINSKVNGTYTNLNPDIGFSFQDGAAVGGRFALVFGTGGLAGQFWPVFVVGAAKPSAVSTASTVIGMELQKDVGIGTGHGFRWLDGSSTLTNLLAFDTTDLALKLGGTQQLKVTNVGALIQASTQLGAASTDGFFYMRSINGTPTGVPTANTGTVPISIDTVASKLWAYVGGAWKGVALA